MNAESEVLLSEILAELKLIRRRMSSDTACGFTSMSNFAGTQCDHEWGAFSGSWSGTYTPKKMCLKCGATK